MARAPVITLINPDLLKGLLPENDQLCTLEATVITGLEDIAAEECREKLGVECVLARGRVFLDIDIDRVPEVLKLRSVDNINVVISMHKNFCFPDTREQCFERLYKLAEQPDWKKGTRVWQQTVAYKGTTVIKIQPLRNEICTPRPDLDLKNLKESSSILDNLPQDIIPSHLRQKVDKNDEEEEENVDVERGSKGDGIVDDEIKTLKDSNEQTGPKFRISCSRTGMTHRFGSPEAARQFGGGVNEVLGWPVDLSHFDLEVLLCIDTDFVYVAICLTKEPLFKRNLTNFGPTNLRSTLCYNLIRLAAPKPGEVLIDPMCGGATIPMEGSLTHKSVLHIGGDNFAQAVKRSRENINYQINKGCSMAVDVAQWDATRLPLRSQTVDAVVSDLPFGKRMGSQADNRVLYFGALVELARVTKVTTGRAILLTHDKNSMIKVNDKEALAMRGLNINEDERHDKEKVQKGNEGLGVNRHMLWPE